MLPPGVVCDQCNNYFARKIEGPLLDTFHFKNLRGRQHIENKRGRIPPQRILFPTARLELDLYSTGQDRSVVTAHERDEATFVYFLLSGRGGTFVIPTCLPVNETLISRFLAKTAIEVLASRLIGLEGWEVELIDNTQLDPVRRYARFGDAPEFWPFNERRIYIEDRLFDDAVGEAYQVLHEFTVLYTKGRELYAIICIFGVEYAINLGGPEADGYVNWLEENSGISPLYLGITPKIPEIQEC